jgi:hypothetical protein
MILSFRFFWDVTMRHWVNSLQIQAALENYLTLKMKTLTSSETSATTYPTTQRHIAEELNLQ